MRVVLEREITEKFIDYPIVLIVSLQYLRATGEKKSYHFTGFISHILGLTHHLILFNNVNPIWGLSF